MKTLTFLIMIFTLTAYSLRSQQQQSYQWARDTVVFDANYLQVPLMNDGSISRANIDTSYYAINYKQGEVMYETGFALSGYINDTLWAAGKSFTLLNEFQCGNYGSSVSDSANRFYIVSEADTPFSSSWQDWAAAVDQGAYFYDGNGNGIYDPQDINGNGLWDLNEDKPDILGDITYWCVYNDGVPSSNRLFTSMEPKGIEIRQTFFSLSDSSNEAAYSTFFIRYSLLNTGAVVDKIDSVYFSICTDGEIDDYYHNMTGCDTVKEAVFFYHTDHNSPAFGTHPPALFIDLLQGPYAFIPGKTFIDRDLNGIYEEDIDSAITAAELKYGSLIGTDRLEGADLVPPVSYTALDRSSVLPDPGNPMVVRRYQKGGMYYDGTPVTLSNLFIGNGDELTGDTTLIRPEYMLSGDPVSRSGWICDVFRDYRNMISAGPFILQAEKPVDIWAAFTVGQGSDNLNSITVSGALNNAVQKFYDNNFADMPLEIQESGEAAVVPVEYKLLQNYPNPFNPTTKIQYKLKKMTDVQLSVYDIAGRRVEELVNGEQPAGKYEIEFDAAGLASGVYFYRLKTDNYIKTKKMVLLK